MTFRRIFSLGLLPTLLLGLYIGHITADGATQSAAPTHTLQMATHNTIVDGPEAFQHFGSRWHSVTQALGDTLAEGSAPDATTRVWERCAIRIPFRGDKNRRTFCSCPDGYSEHW